MTLFNRLNNKKSSKKGVVGIEVGDRGVAFAHLKLSPSLALTSCNYLTAADETSIISTLREDISSLHLENTPCNVALSTDDYALLLVEPPKVPENELRDAIQWKIKDLSPIPIEKAVIDVFRMPENAGSVGKGMVFTVVAKKAAVENLVSLVEGAGLKMNAIDIPELCLRNFALLQHSEQSMLIARLMSDNSQVTAISRGELYLSRLFNFRYTGGVISEERAENLTLELQRSADYLRHQMHQPTPSQILLLGNGLQDRDLPESINDNFSGEVKTLDISDALPITAGVDRQVLNRYAIASGAALSDHVSTLGVNR